MADYVAKALSMPITVDGSKVSKTFELKDAAAREATVGGIHFKGVTTTALTDGATTASIQVGSPAAAYTPAHGDIVAYLNKEFIYDKPGNDTGVWHEFGDISELGDLAAKSSASGSYTPAGDLDDFDVTLTIDEGSYVMDDPSTDGGSVTAGSADSLTMNVSGSTLQISWTAGAPTEVTLPTFTQQDIVTGVTSVTQPSFDGDEETIEVS